MNCEIDDEKNLLRLYRRERSRSPRETTGSRGRGNSKPRTWELETGRAGLQLFRLASAPGRARPQSCQICPAISVIPNRSERPVRNLLYRPCPNAGPSDNL